MLPRHEVPVSPLPEKEEGLYSFYAATRRTFCGIRMESAARAGVASRRAPLQSGAHPSLRLRGYSCADCQPLCITSARIQAVLWHLNLEAARRKNGQGK